MATDKLYLVITAVGPDRPGIVSDLSALIHQAGANLEDSRMAVLGGEFALLLLVSGPEASLSHVEERAEGSQRELGLRLLHKRTSGPQRHRDLVRCSLRVSGFDRPGIVQSVTHVLAQRGVNVSALESRVTHAAHSGTPLFSLEAELELPSELAVSDLQRELAQKSEEESLELTLESSS